MSPRRIGIVLGGLFLVLGGLVFAGAEVVSPGPVTAVHQEETRECRSCHEPFEAVGSSCVACHGALREGNPHAAREVGLAEACAGCHSEHRGLAQLLGTEPALMERSCGGCHPEGELRELIPLGFHESSFGLGDFSDPAPPGSSWNALSYFLLIAGPLYLGLVLVLPGAPRVDESTQGREDLGRIIDLPILEDFESSVPGVYVVGELAGVPLINRAMKSGFDAVDFISMRLKATSETQDDDCFDVLIVGAGPSGLGAATRAQDLGVSFVFCEKSTVAATIRDYPRDKIVQSAPIEIPNYGTFFQEEDESKEDLIRRWNDVIARTGIRVREREEVIQLGRESPATFEARTSTGNAYRSRFVILALGVRGAPRRLGVPGESSARVFYLLEDASVHREKKILIVGGGDAACEAALALCAPGLQNRVVMAHRGASLRNVTSRNAQEIDGALREGALEVLPDVRVAEITGADVRLEDSTGGSRRVACDEIFVFVGAEPPTGFLQSVGVRLQDRGMG